MAKSKIREHDPRLAIDRIARQPVMNVVRFRHSEDLFTGGSPHEEVKVTFLKIVESELDSIYGGKIPIRSIIGVIERPLLFNEIGSTLLQAAIDEARESGAYGVQILGAETSKTYQERKVIEEFLEAHGFRRSDRDAHSGKPWWVIRFDELPKSKNPVQCQIEITEGDNFIYVRSGPSDLFCDTKERSHVGITFWPEFQGVSQFTRTQLKRKYPELVDKPVGDIFEFGANFFPIGKLSSDLFGVAIHEAKMYGAPALFATALWEYEPGLSDLFKKHGMSDTGVLDDYQNHVYVIFFDRETASNPSPIQIERFQAIMDDIIHYVPVEDLFHGGSPGSRVYMSIREVENLDFMSPEAPAYWLRIMRNVFQKEIDIGDKVAIIWTDFTEQPEQFGTVTNKRLWPIYTELIKAAVGEARLSGALGAYVLGGNIESSWAGSIEKALRGILTGMGFTRHRKIAFKTSSIYAIRFDEPAKEST